MSTPTTEPRIVLENFEDSPLANRIVSTLERAGIRSEVIHVE
ncbi:hypothetical protein [Natronolimnobius sp. AArcel1]|nr:hypothetical protein [Natronolimnobius sp. AArcel1]